VIAQIYSVHNFDPVVVTGSRIPTEFSNSSRNITVIGEEYITTRNSASIESLLESLTDLQLETRGPEGIQTDISIRGASGEQTLILIDGMKMSDPQTAHHSMNIPVNIADIAQIEILKGNASKIYGPNALGGVINIITKNAEKASGKLNMTGGDFGYKAGSFSYAMPTGNFHQRVSLTQKSSDGYRKNTAFDVTNVFYKAGLQTNPAKYDVSFGYQRKDFGANGFYSSTYPLQHEDTESYITAFSVFVPQNWGHLSCKISGRQHYDHFLLDKTNPSFYENKHKTNVLAGEINGLLEAEKYALNFGAEVGRDEISSNSLGDHHRSRFGLYGEAIYNVSEKLSLSPGLSGYYYRDWGFQVFPGIDVGYQFRESWKIFGSLGRSFRIPSFTDLYYKSPANSGNENLKPEKAISGETGIRYNKENLLASLTIFHRNISNLIEYTRKDQKDPWLASNISHMNTTGLEVTFKYSSNTSLFKTVQLSYSYLENGIDSDEFQGKYIANSLNQNGSLNIFQSLPWNLSAGWDFIYKKIQYQNQEVVTVNFRADIPVNSLRLYVHIQNLLNEKYAYFESVPMPGRWFKAGIEYNL
jgi:iron complex outermembrane receptor protein